MTVYTARVAPNDVDHELIWGWVGLTTLALGVWMLRRVWLPPIACLFRALTGLPCLTCGATRAFVALIGGDLAASLRWHPLVAPATALTAGYVPYALLVAHAKLPRVRVRLGVRDRRMLRIAAGVTAAAVWAYLILDGR